MPKGFARALILSLLLSIVAIALVIALIGSPSGLGAILNLSWRSLLLGGLLLGLSFFVGGLRIQRLLYATGSSLSAWRAMRTFILGIFSAALTPSGGGNAPAIALSLIHERISPPVAWSVTIYTSTLDLLFFGWSLPVAVLILRRSDYFGRPWLLWLGLGLSVLFLGLWVGLAFFLSRLERLLGILLSPRALRRWRRPAWRFLRRMNEVTSIITGRRLTTHLSLQGLTLLLHGSVYSIFFVFARGLGAELAFAPTMALMFLVSVTSYVIPTPGASGYLELAVSFAFAKELEISLLTAAVVAYRAISYYLTIVIGALLGGNILAREIADTARADAGNEGVTD